MSKDFVSFGWTGWNDCVGARAKANIEGTLADLDSAYNNFDAAAQRAENVLRHRVSYTSQGARIKALEVTDHD